MATPDFIIDGTWIDPAPDVLHGPRRHPFGVDATAVLIDNVAVIFPDSRAAITHYGAAADAVAAHLAGADGRTAPSPAPIFYVGHGPDCGAPVGHISLNVRLGGDLIMGVSIEEGAAPLEIMLALRSLADAIQWKLYPPKPVIYPKEARP